MQSSVKNNFYKNPTPIPLKRSNCHFFKCLKSAPNIKSCPKNTLTISISVMINLIYSSRL
jgi:hypothetical protein